MKKPAEPSSIEDYQPGTFLLTLPVPGARGKPLVAEIEEATLEELIPMMKGITRLGRDRDEKVAEEDPLELTIDFVRKYGEGAQPLIERFVRSPRISFNGPQPGAVEWGKLHLLNRFALVNAISEYAQTGSVRRAEQLSTFLADEPGGRRDGGNAARAVENGRASAPEVPDAARADADASAVV